MVVLGVVLVLLALVFATGLLLDNWELSSVSFFGLTGDASLGGMFIAGALTMLVVVLGLAMLSTGLGRARRHRADDRRKRREHAAEDQQVASERDQAAVERENLERRPVRPGDPLDESGGRPPGSASDPSSGTRNGERRP